ncbi:uncharacterized protein LOC132547857 [Ylistrum balloti]|uniref:uncharacterized protein LOC132547857 n=1 Tax=Ylistrum balloti TaxID=509963 RepID=UPI002905A9DD|nr:uncharacterized protein LOC132547857 [Ylistrum balloti]
MPQDPCQQDKNCFLPNCFCSTFNHQMNPSDIPQIVYFGFDDAVNIGMAGHYDYLFLKDNITNPNGCPVSITLFVSDKYTDYSIVKRYHDVGFELGVHSVTHSHLNSGQKVRNEAEEQRDNLITKAGVSKEEVIGWRSPFLTTAGDQQIDALKQLGFKYDISLQYVKNKIDDDDVWPFTMDFGWPFKCNNNRCPKQHHKGFWQVPLNALMDFKHQYGCSFVDGCRNVPSNEEETYKFIMDNFYSHYNGNRAPLGLNMHAAYFETSYKREGMRRAIRNMTQYEDVYIVNVKQMLEWMEKPTTISEIRTFDGFGCWPRKQSKKPFLHIFLIVVPFSTLVILCIVLLLLTCRNLSRRFRNNDYVILNGKEHIEKLVNGSDDTDLLGFKYDISLKYVKNKIDDDDVWPFTMDFGWPFKCNNNRCPKQHHKGFWQVPLNALMDFKHQYGCSFVDGCRNVPSNEEETYKLIMDNFYSHYNGNRAPLGLNMHAAYFETSYKREVMRRAIRNMTQYEDVYIVNVKQMLEWMEKPTTISEIRTFDGFGCWPRKQSKKPFLHIFLIVVPFSTLVILCIVLLLLTCRNLSRRFRNNDYVILNGKEHIEKLVNGSDDTDL